MENLPLVVPAQCLMSQQRNRQAQFCFAWFYSGELYEYFGVQINPRLRNDAVKFSIASQNL